MSSVIEVTIPLRYLQDRGENIDFSDTASENSIEESAAETNTNECVICMNAVCQTRECSRSPTQTSCCSQVLCCGCFVKLLRRCKCTAVCRAVTGSCPFCRDMMRADSTLQVFMATIPPCTKCQTKQQQRRSLDVLPPTLPRDIPGGMTTNTAP